MVKVKQKKKKSKLSNKTIIAISVISLVLISLGIYSLLGNFNNNENVSGDAIASVNGEEITSQDILIIQQAFSQGGQQISEKEALEQAINQELLYQKIKEENISITTQEAEIAISQQLQLQNISLEDYKKQIESQGLSYQSQLNQIKDQMITQEYLDNAIVVKDITKEQAESFYQMYKEQSNEEIPEYSEIEPQIIATLEQEQKQQALGNLIQEIREGAEIEYY